MSLSDAFEFQMQSVLESLSSGGGDRKLLRQGGSQGDQAATVSSSAQVGASWPLDQRLSAIPGLNEASGGTHSRGPRASPDCGWASWLVPAQPGAPTNWRFGMRQEVASSTLHPNCWKSPRSHSQFITTGKTDCFAGRLCDHSVTSPDARSIPSNIRLYFHLFPAL